MATEIDFNELSRGNRETLLWSYLVPLYYLCDFGLW